MDKIILSVVLIFFVMKKMLFLTVLWGVGASQLFAMAKGQEGYFASFVPYLVEHVKQERQTEAVKEEEIDKFYREAEKCGELSLIEIMSQEKKNKESLIDDWRQHIKKEREAGVSLKHKDPTKTKDFALQLLYWKMVSHKECPKEYLFDKKNTILLSDEFA